jgi:hypothetical protein
MLRRLATAVVCVLLLAAVPTGSLYVTTLPTGADVWIDGTYVGRSPLVLGALAAGRHTVGLTKTTRLEPLRSGGLHALPGWIAIHGVVRTAQVDGRPMVPAKDGTIVVTAGTHELTARTPRGRITRSVMVWPGTRTDVVLQPDAEVVRPSVVAPAEDYVPRGAIQLVGEKVVGRYGGHEVVGHIGSTSYRVDGKLVDYGEAPTMIGSRLYLPLDLLTTLSSDTR